MKVKRSEMNMFRKVFAVFLTMMVLLQTTPLSLPVRAETVITYSNTQYEEGFKFWWKGNGVYENGREECDMEWDKIRLSLPKKPNGSDLPKTIMVTINGKTYTQGFNFTLWYAKHVVVYGDYAQPGLNPRLQVVGGNRDWKTKRDDPDCGTYYEKGSERGEYRYHGYDVAGNRYSNTDFPVDSPSKGMNNYTWLFMPWRTDHARITHASESIWNQAAEAADRGIQGKNNSNELVRLWISKMYKDETSSGDDTDDVSKYTYLDFSKTSDSPDGEDGQNMGAHYYANIMSPPTVKYPGEAKLWIVDSNLKPTSKYRTTFINTIETKCDTPVEVTGNVVSPTLRDIRDMGKANQNKYLDEKIDVVLQVKGTLKDLEFVKDPVLVTTQYTRNDMLEGTKAWTLGMPSSVEKTQYTTNVAPTNADSYTDGKFTVKMSRRTILDAVKDPVKKGVIAVPVTAEAHFYDKKAADKTHKVIANGTINVDFTATPLAPQEETALEEILTPPPVVVEPNVILPDPAFDIVPYRPIDNVDHSKVASKTLYVDGKPVDYNTFFSGSYTFGETGYDRLANIIVRFISTDGTESFVSRWIRVLNTKPRVQFRMVGEWKENRKMTLNNTSLEANTPEVIAAYPINQYTWTTGSLTGSNSDIKTGTLTDMLREFTFKAPGSYRITLVGTNTLGRVSDPYILEFEILPDTPPAIICELDNVSLARGEALGAYVFEAVSTDGDEIENTKVELYYDSNNDGDPEQLVNTWNNVLNGEFPIYTPDKLGMYRYKITSTDRMKGDMIPGHVMAEDAKVKTIERDFWVDNYVPQTGLYIDIPIVRPEIDVYIMLDKNLPQEKTDSVKTGRMDLNNYLRLNNINPRVEIWDMKTYTYSQPASTSRGTGTSYPPSTTSYSSNGYSGTLTRYSVSDNGSNQDFGSYQTKTESRTFTASWSNTNVHYGTVKPYTDNFYETSPAPSSYPINSDGYVGNIPRTGTVMTSDTGKVVSGNNWTWSRTFVASYSGTLSKTVQYWVSDWRWVSNYTGFYSGTICKDVRQPYTDPFRATSDKYILYVSDEGISELPDLNMVQSKATGSLILVTGEEAKVQTAFSGHVDSSQPIEDAVTQALDFIIQHNPAVEQRVVLAGSETFNMSVDDFDQENDPLVEKKFQYVQEANYFDNSTGMESYAVSQYSDTAGWWTTP